MTSTRNHRWAVAGIVAVSAVALSGCGIFTQGSPGSTNPTLPSASIVASPVPTTAATGSFSLYYPVTDKLTGTCAVAGTTQVVLAEKGNEAFGTINITMVIDPAAQIVHTVNVDLGEDSEGIVRKMSYQSASPVAGTNAVMTVTGNSYQVKGTAEATETRYGKAIAPEKLPFVIKATCSKG